MSSLGIKQIASEFPNEKINACDIPKFCRVFAMTASCINVLLSYFIVLFYPHVQRLLWCWFLNMRHTGICLVSCVKVEDWKTSSTVHQCVVNRKWRHTIWSLLLSRLLPAWVSWRPEKYESLFNPGPRKSELWKGLEIDSSAQESTRVVKGGEKFEFLSNFTFVLVWPGFYQARNACKIHLTSLLSPLGAASPFG